MGTRVIIPNSDFNQNGMPLYNDVVFTTKEDATVSIKFNNTVTVEVDAAAGNIYGINCSDDFVSAENMLYQNSVINKIININSDSIITFQNAFTSMINLEEFPAIRISNQCSNMNYAFYDCEKLQELDMSNWDLSGCNTFLYAFSSCYELTSIDMSHLQVAANTILTDMFSGCTNLISIKMPKAISPYRTMEMFAGCSSLQEIDFTQFGLPVTDQHSGLLRGCTNLMVMYCNAENVQYFKDRATDAGLTFIEYSNYVLRRNV